jgi:hypothetical protein
LKVEHTEGSSREGEQSVSLTVVVIIAIAFTRATGALTGAFTGRIVVIILEKRKLKQQCEAS